MRISDINQWLTLLGNIAILAGIIFLSMEIQQSNRIALSEQERSRIGHIIALNNQMIQNAEVWDKCGSGEELSSKEGIICDNIIMAHWGRMYSATVSYERFGDDRRVGIHDFAKFLYLNPGARERWTSLMEQEQHYREILIPGSAGVELMEVVFADLNKLDENHH
jgi:hypothetical protein